MRNHSYQDGMLWTAGQILNVVACIVVRVVITMPKAHNMNSLFKVITFLM